ncbi:Uncharacterised protein [Vibrio cholerae]|nr:Uncharacterised protein [Vibrio cholerae]
MNWRHQTSSYVTKNVCCKSLWMRCWITAVVVVRSRARTSVR